MKTKKILLSLIATILLLPALVSAKEYCAVVSGNGKDIGSEINCGGEHFYIIDSNDSNIRMLSKYNLDTGAIYDKVTVSRERFEELKSNYCTDNYCTYRRSWYLSSLMNEPEFVNYKDWELDNVFVYLDNCTFIFYRYIQSENEIRINVSNERFMELYNQYAVFYNNTDLVDYIDDNILKEPEFSGINRDLVRHINYYQEDHYFYVIESNISKQNPIAIGAHGDEAGNPEFPEYGVVGGWGMGFLSEDTTGEAYGGGSYQDVNPFYNDNGQSYNSYKKYLKDSGFQVENVDFLSIKDLDNVVYNLSNKRLPLEEWIENWQEGYSALGSNYYKVGNFKSYLPSGYEWLYSTTYWTKTMNPNEADYMRPTYFIDTLGTVCIGSACDSMIGAGIRPVITIGKDSIKYNITTKTDNNGTIDVVKESNAGEEISFVLKSNEGYKLRSITLETESGIKVEFDQISEIENGRVIVNTNKFVMPAENVKIIANWEKEEELVPEPEPEPTPSEPEEIKEYNIKTVVEGDGSIVVIEKSVAGENIEFTIIALNGSKLVEFTVKDKDGNDVKYTKVSDDGNIVINKYIMPENDVIIRAKFESVVPVPKTGDNIMKYVTILMISFMVLVFLAFVARKNNN